MSHKPSTSQSSQKRTIGILANNCYFGCPRSKNTFDAYLGLSRASVDFYDESRKIVCCFHCKGGLYERCKFELSYSSIWNIELHRDGNNDIQSFLIQFLHVPLFFSTDDGIRIIDPTKSKINNFASSICMTFQGGNNYSLYFRKAFPSLEELHGVYSVQMSKPVDFPPQSITTFGVSFKVQSLIHHGCLSRQVLGDEFLQLLVEHESREEALIVQALDDMFKLFCDNPMDWKKTFYYQPHEWLLRYYSRSTGDTNFVLDSLAKSTSSLFYIRKVLVTPCKKYFRGPEPSASNRILRQYAHCIDHFLRVSFVDEDFRPLYKQQLCVDYDGKERTSICRRMTYTMERGIVIDGKRFQFLAFSSSQVRKSSLWMFAPTQDGSITAATIRDDMGDFSQIKNVAKYAARLGLPFSSSTETLSIKKEEIETIPDIEREGYVFSDGIGKISSECAKHVSKLCGYGDPFPCAFQIRYGGYKGVVAIDPSSTFKLSLRGSMEKFKSKNQSLDVLDCARLRPAYLNRQLITLLSTLGIKDEIFLRKQQREIETVLSMSRCDAASLKDIFDFLKDGAEIIIILKEMLNVFDPVSEPFLSMMISVFKRSMLLKIHNKWKIHISEGNFLMGCLDESGTLEYGQVFIQRRTISSGGQSDDSSEIIKGKVVVCRSPCLHPGMLDC